MFVILPINVTFRMNVTFKTINFINLIVFKVTFWVKLYRLKFDEADLFGFTRV